MAYDTARGRLVLFGGMDGAGLDVDTTWEWDGATWRLRAPATRPPRRYDHAMAYDAARQRVVIFGGKQWDSMTTLSDTWEWDGTTWSERTATTSPSGRVAHAMVYDATRQRVVLFGGWAGANYTGAADTWEWNGMTWTERLSVTAPPTARGGHAMAYDSVRERVVLFGGVTINQRVINDTWEWDGSNWTQRTSVSAPSARSEHAMAYDAARQRIVLFGGASSLADTWEWDGSTWTLRTPPTSPPGRGKEVLAYDPTRQRIVLFGHSRLPHTWEWDGTTWTQRLPVAQPPELVAPATAYDAARQRVVLFGGGTWGGGIVRAETWEWDGAAWSQRLPTSSPPARAEHAMAYDTARQRVVLFGGHGGAGKLADTWEWDGETWSQRLSAASPSARTEHALAYDAARQRVVLFGGSSSQGVLADTWEWNGATWTQRITASAPTARCGHALAYDSARQRMVLFGGRYPSPGNASLLRVSDTWEWDGSTWTQCTPLSAPTARSQYALAYDSTRQLVVLFGGMSTVDRWDLALADTWEWDGAAWTPRVSGAAPTARAHHTLAYHVGRRQLVLFGGVTSAGELADTWLLQP